MASLLDFLVDQRLILGVLSSTLAGIVIFLIIIERKVSRHPATEQLPKEPLLEERITELLGKSAPNEQVFAEIDHIARPFLAKTFNIPAELEYGEMAERFNQLKKNRAAEFAKRMLEYTYAGEKINSYRIAILVSLLKKINEEEQQALPAPEPTGLARIAAKFHLLPEKKDLPAPIPEQKEDLAPLVFENIRNLQPITIEPEPFQPQGAKRKGIKVSASVIDNLEALRARVGEKKNALL
ncbi:MAG TPA: hypothetical protein VJK03_04015 [Candidatus Nanoarchaeia archaeon]|nr:hypothetical protein [Candidatus Nanoarchaeia archaeon]